MRIVELIIQVDLHRLCTPWRFASQSNSALTCGQNCSDISLYLFFWPDAEEVEEERAVGKNAEQRKGATDEELRNQRTDVMTGMFFSNFILYFIILTTAATLHAHGQTHISPAREAAEALRGWLETGLIGYPPWA